MKCSINRTKTSGTLHSAIEWVGNRITCAVTSIPDREDQIEEVDSWQSLGRSLLWSITTELRGTRDQLSFESVVSGLDMTEFRVISPTAFRSAISQIDGMSPSSQDIIRSYSEVVTGSPYDWLNLDVDSSSRLGLYLDKLIIPAVGRWKGFRDDGVGVATPISFDGEISSFNSVIKKYGFEFSLSAKFGSYSALVRNRILTGGSSEDISSLIYTLEGIPVGEDSYFPVLHSAYRYTKYQLNQLLY